MQRKSWRLFDGRHLLVSSVERLVSRVDSNNP